MGVKNKKTVGLVLLVVGIVLFVVSVAANPLGIGNPDTFGREQIIGTVVGAVVALVGAALTLRG
jgi:hypothetical protein